MKKVMLFGLALLLLGSGLFAEDAKVMPMMVGRVYAVPSFSFITGAYDDDGDYDSFDDTLRVFNLGFALEYGVIDWITAAVQWTPGWTPWSDIEGAVPEDITAKAGALDTNGVADLFVGAKLQFAGEKAPLVTNRFRFAVAPGVVIPMPGPDFEDEVETAVVDGGDATFKSMDNHVLGAGGRIYFDYIINENFFINLYNETLFYPVKRDLNKDGPGLAGFKAALPGKVYEATYEGARGLGYPHAVADQAALAKMAGAKDLADKLEGEVSYKYKLTFELEPVFSTPLSEGIGFTAGLPVNYVFTPAFDYTVDNLDALAAFLDTTEDQLLEQAGLVGEASHTLILRPNLAFFLTALPLPLEFKFQYDLPVYGKNAQAMHTASLQIRVYFALPGRPQ